MARKKMDEEGLNKLDMVEGATNSTILSEDVVTLEGRTFRLKHLKYDDYIAFMAYLKPVFGPLFEQLGGFAGGTQEVIDYAKIVGLCQSNLPEMALLVLKQDAPELTIKDVKDLCGTPFKMAELVLMQINKNNLIADFTNFFGLMTQMLKV